MYGTAKLNPPLSTMAAPGRPQMRRVLLNEPARSDLGVSQASDTRAFGTECSEPDERAPSVVSEATDLEKGRKVPKVMAERNDFQHWR